MLFSTFQLKAQHDMKDMPGMKMPVEKKVVKKPVAKETKTNPSEKVIYTCVMHPQIQKDKPGNCPICGMKLVKKTVKTTATKTVPPKMNDMNMPMQDTTHKMDMNMKMDKDTGMDNMQGMDMTKKENANQSQPTTYTCVMHPQIHSPKPGNCPICGMKLIKEKTKVSDDHNKHDKMQMPMKDTSKKMDNMDMSNMKMDNMQDMDMAKKNLGDIKFITNNAPPRTVVYRFIY